MDERHFADVDASEVQQVVHLLEQGLGVTLDDAQIGLPAAGCTHCPVSCFSFFSRFCLRRGRSAMGEQGADAFRLHENIVVTNLARGQAHVLQCTTQVHGLDHASQEAVDDAEVAGFHHSVGRQK